jgi:hypothetical protein
MIRNTLLAAAAFIATAAFSAVTALAEGVSVTSCTTTQGATANSNATTNVAVKIQNLRRGRRFKDIHIYPPEPESKPGPTLPPLKKGSGGTVTINSGATGSTPAKEPDGKGGEKDANWKCEQDDSGIHVYDDGDGGGLGEGDYNLTFTWKGQTVSTNDKECRFVFTDNGAKNYKDLDTLGPGDLTHKGENTRTKKGFPNAVVRLDGPGDGPVALARGAWTTLTVAGDPITGTGFSYQILFSEAIDQTWQDGCECGIAAWSQPVPASWGVEARSCKGFLDAAGTPTTAPQLYVPDVESLAGNEFYMVLRVLDADGNEVRTSAPVRAVIQ